MRQPVARYYARAAEENRETWKFQTGAEGEAKVTYHFKMDDKLASGSFPGMCKFELPDSATVTVPALQVNHNYSPAACSNKYYPQLDTPPPGT